MSPSLADLRVHVASLQSLQQRLALQVFRSVAHTVNALTAREQHRLQSELDARVRRSDEEKVGPAGLCTAWGGQQRGASALRALPLARRACAVRPGVLLRAFTPLLLR